MNDADRAAYLIARMSLDDKVALVRRFRRGGSPRAAALSFTDGGNGVRGRRRDRLPGVPVARGVLRRAAGVPVRVRGRRGDPVRRSQCPARAGPGHRAHAAGRAAARGVRGGPLPHRRPGSGLRPGCPTERRGHGQALRGQQLRDGPDRGGLAATGPGAGGRRPRLPPGLGRIYFPPFRAPTEPTRVRSWARTTRSMVVMPASTSCSAHERPVGMGRIRRPDFMFAVRDRGPRGRASICRG
jgi:hypothetical protein